jgi:7-cyano-7-deazaguanine synthase
MKKAIVLISGGIDSATCAAIARDEGFALYAMSFRYGQRHSVELEAAKMVCRHLQVRTHRIVDIDLRAFGGSSLTDSIPVPKRREIDAAIPNTYVPARNTIFLSFALGWAETLSCTDIFIGVTAVDYSGYPDCRPEFIDAFQRVANRGTKLGVEGHPIRIHAPLIQMRKAEIIRRGVTLGVDYGMTHSCYDPAQNGAACGECDSCRIRKQGFADAGVDDPTVYV